MKETTLTSTHPTRAILVKRMQNGGSAHIIGVEHLSPSSATLARQLILAKRPESVILELDETRAKAFGVSLSTSSRPLTTFYKESGGFPGITPMLFIFLAGSITSSLAELYDGHEYGGEALAAASAANEVGASIVLGDRDISLTLQRVASDIDINSLQALLPTALGGVHCSPKFIPNLFQISELVSCAIRRDWIGLANILEIISKESDDFNLAFSESPSGRALHLFNTSMISVIREGQISTARKVELGSNLQRVLFAMEASHEFSSLVPAAISTERDRLLMHAIRWSQSSSVVAVVGAGHLDGIARYWAEQEDSEKKLGLVGSNAQKAAKDTISSYLQSPPFATLKNIGAPLGSLAITLMAARAVAKRSRGAFFVLTSATVMCGSLCGIVLQRVGEVRDRVRMAIAYPID